MNKDNNEPAAPDALQAFTNCPEWGVGGQFIYDPATKQRTRVDDTPAPVGTVSVVSEAPITTSTTAESASKKERNRA
ncbi:MAG: hypothetical protein M3Y65_21725 [Pseudomonadota bacterium]|nr:hypothetical protein [Pseudomonadota bacterium]